MIKNKEKKFAKKLINLLNKRGFLVKAHKSKTSKRTLALSIACSAVFKANKNPVTWMKDRQKIKRTGR